MEDGWLWRDVANMKQVRTHKFNGKKYYIDIDTAYGGYCENPDDVETQKEHPVIRIVEGLPYKNRKGAKNGLVRIIHETLHAEDWGKHEETVVRVAKEIGSLLWRLGYRRIE